MTRREALREASRELKGAGCPSPHVDAELLLSHALGVSRTDLYTDSELALSAGEKAHFDAVVARRVAREPVAYILGEWGFRHLTLKVDARVLVPRPETEMVVERCLAHLAEVDEPLVLDVGTGSGAIALSIASEHPTARVVATDIFPEALALAAENRALTGLEDRVELVLGYLVAGLRGPFDLVVSNPPYVTPEEFETLEPEVRLFEPYEALVGAGQTEGVARRASDILRAGGWLVLECGQGDAQDVAAELRSLGFEDIEVVRDLAGRDRIVEARWP